MSPESRLSILEKNRSRLKMGTSARNRIEQLFDEGTFVELDAFCQTYGEGAGVITGYGLIGGGGAYVFSQDVAVNSGAVDASHAKKVKRVYELAAMTGLPIVGIFDSNGARLDDVPTALNAYGEMMLDANKVSGVIPQISLVLGTCAGASAMMACSADFVIMSEQAEFFLNSPRVAENSGTSSPGAGTAQSTAKSGVAHLVAENDEEAIQLARKLSACLPQNNLSLVPEGDYKDPPAGVKALKTACEAIEYTAFTDIIPYIVDQDSLLMMTDAYGPNAKIGFATVYGITVMLVGAEKTLGIDECNKIAYFVNVADCFSIPVITFLNTDGFSPLNSDELSGSLRHAAKLGHIYARSTTQKVAVITGKAYGNAYIAMAGKNSGSDFIMAWPSAVISALFPTTAVAFLAGDLITSESSRQDAEEQYKVTDASPFTYAAEGYIDSVISPEETRDMILTALDILAGKRINTMDRKHTNMPL